MMNKIPLLKALRNDRWVRPFTKVSLDISISNFVRDFNVCLCRRANVYGWIPN